LARGGWGGGIGERGKVPSREGGEKSRGPGPGFVQKVGYKPGRGKFEERKKSFEVRKKFR